MEIGVWPTGGGQLYSTQYEVRRSLSQTIWDGTVQRAVGRPKFERHKRGAGENWAANSWFQNLNHSNGCIVGPPTNSVVNCTVGPRWAAPTICAVGLSLVADRPEACAHIGGSVLWTRPSGGLYSMQKFCAIRKSLSQTIWACTAGCVQWVDPTGQLAQFGTKRAKRGAGV